MAFIARARSYKVEINWTQDANALFILGLSQLGGTAKLGSSAWDETFTGPYVDVTQYMDWDAGLQTNRGRDSFLGPFRSGQLDGYLIDPDGIFNPRNEASPLWGNVRPRRAVRVSCIGPASYRVHVLNDTPLHYCPLDDRVVRLMDLIDPEVTIQGPRGAVTPFIYPGISGEWFGSRAGQGQPTIVGFGQGYCTDFDGSTTYAQTLDTAADDMAGTQPFTIEAIVNLDAVDGTERRIAGKESASNDGYALIYSNAGWKLTRHDGTAADSAVGGTPQTGVTYHVIGSYDGANLTVRVNDTLVAGPTASSRSLPGNAVPFTIGRKAGAASGFLSGRASDVALYDKALASGRVTAHRNAMKELPDYTDEETYPYFYGFLRRIYSTPSRRGYVSFSAVDLLTRMAKIKPTIAAVPNTDTGASIGKVLDALEWTTPSLRDLDNGDPFPSFSADGSKDGVQLVQELLDAERGAFFIEKGGAAIFRGRHHRLVYSPNAAVLNLMTAFDAEVDEELIRNRATVTRTGGVAQTATDADSIAEFGVNDQDAIESPYFISDAVALGLAQWIVMTGKNPDQRVRSLELDAREEGLLATILRCDLGDTVYVKEGEQATGGVFTIEGINERVTKEAHRATWTLSTADPINLFLLDSSQLGGSDILGH